MSDTTGAPAPTQYMSFPENCAMDLILTLIPRLYGGERYQIKTLTEQANVQLLEEIVIQVDNCKCSLHSLKEGLGTALAVASQSGELPERSVTDIGWGIRFLANLEEALDSLKSDSEYSMKHPEAKEWL